MDETEFMQNDGICEKCMQEKNEVNRIKRKIKEKILSRKKFLNFRFKI